MLANQSGKLSKERSRFSKQKDSNTHCSRDENHCPASVSQDITHLFCRGIPEVDRLGDGARQIPSKPQKDGDFGRPSLHRHQSSTQSCTLAISRIETC
jgi:hypothetical protein